MRVFGSRDTGGEFVVPGADGLERAFTDLVVVLFADLAVDDQRCAIGAWSAGAWTFQRVMTPAGNTFDCGARAPLV